MQTIPMIPLLYQTIARPEESFRIIHLPIHKGIGVMRARGHSFPGGRCMSRNHEAIVLDGFANHHAHIRGVHHGEGFSCAMNVYVFAEEVHGVAYFRRSEEHTSELQSLMRISYAVFCLQQKT